MDEDHILAYAKIVSVEKLSQRVRNQISDEKLSQPARNKF